ncbi:hypothetical protein HY029_04355 [Candidatus Gottesmanbacteria bacterium]|nr:hypothetical protein [Candidatus Gottesmanbacteria bacterium]
MVNIQFAYLISIMIFAGFPLILEIIFGYHLIKQFLRKLFVPIIIALILTPILENVAFFLDVWHFNPERNLKIVIFGDVLETYIFAVLVLSAVYFAVCSWTFYEDRGKPIIRTSLYDLFHGTYAIWRKNKTSKCK